MNVARSTVGTKKSRQPKRQKSLELVQSRQSLTTVRQEVQEKNIRLIKSLSTADATQYSQFHGSC